MDIRYIHRQLKIGDPARSRIHKQLTGSLVVGWVTTSESVLMYLSQSFASPLHFVLVISLYTCPIASTP